VQLGLLAVTDCVRRMGMFCTAGFEGLGLLYCPLAGSTGLCHSCRGCLLWHDYLVQTYVSALVSLSDCGALCNCWAQDCCTALSPAVQAVCLTGRAVFKYRVAISPWTLSTHCRCRMVCLGSEAFCCSFCHLQWLLVPFLGVFVTREHVRHNKSGIAHWGRTGINH
jgi:hypothetical protein